MGEALNIATQQGAYTLSDRGTFISQRSEIDLVVLVQGPIENGPEILANPYGVMAVNPVSTTTSTTTSRWRTSGGSPAPAPKTRSPSTR